MTTAALSLDGLIRDVRGTSDDVLVQLQAAAQRASDLADLGDSLLSHFVDQCRRAGHTWSDIGAHLGVTKQAAQKRFVDSVGETVTFERFTMRAREALDRAVEVATEMQHNYVGTEHELLALFDIDRGLAARALAELGVSRKAVEREILDRIGKGSQPVTGPVPFTPRARKVLEEAVNVSLELGHNYIGTEHLLLGLYRGQEGVALLVLEHLGASRAEAKAKVIELLAGFAPPPSST